MQKFKYGHTAFIDNDIDGVIAEDMKQHQWKY